MPKPKGMAPIIYLLIGILAAALTTVVLVQVVGVGTTITKTVTTTVTTTVPITPTTPPRTTPPPAITVPPITTTVTTTTTITITPTLPPGGVGPIINITLPCYIIQIAGTNATIMGDTVFPTGPFFIDVKVTLLKNLPNTCKALLDASTSGSVVKVSGGPYPVPNNAGEHGPYHFEFVPTGPGPGTITFDLQISSVPGAVCVANCTGRPLRLEVRPINMTCRPRLTIVDTNMTLSGPGLYEVLPGGKYYFAVGVSGPAHPGVYNLRAQILGSLSPYITWLSPNPQPLSYNPPWWIPSTLNFVFKVSPSAVPGSSGTLLLNLYRVRPPYPPCNASLAVMLRVQRPPCVVEFAVQSNATFDGSRYLMTAGNTYEFNVTLFVASLYASASLTLSAPNAQVSAYDYWVYSGNVNVQPHPSFNPNSNKFDLVPISPSTFSGKFRFLVRPGPNTNRIEITFNQLNCTRGVVYGAKVGPPTQQLSCRVWLNVPRYVQAWVDGSNAYRLYEYLIDVLSDPSNLFAQVTLNAPLPMQGGLTPSQGSTPFSPRVQLFIQQNIQPGIYQVTYAVSALASGGVTCSNRNVTLVNVSRCWWSIKVLNSTPLYLQVGRSAKLLVDVSGVPLPGLLFAVSSGAGLGIDPQSITVNQWGTYAFNLKPSSAGNYTITIQAFSRDYRYCMAETSIKAYVTP